MEHEPDHRQADKKVLVETRGTGGYVAAPGSPALLHETGRRYEHLSGPDIAETPHITLAEREIILRCARSLTKCVDEEPNRQANQSPQRFEDGRQENRIGTSPGDDFNTRAAWEEILEPHGWTKSHDAGGVAYWCRPDKAHGWSATTGLQSKAGNSLLCVFSSNADPFGIPAGKTCGTYNKFSAYALLKPNNDFSAAGKALYAAGYGDRTEGVARKGDGESGTDARPKITITPDERAVIDRAIDCLEDHPDLYRRSGTLVTVLRDERKVKGIIRPAGSPRNSPVQLPTLREWLADKATVVVLAKGLDDSWTERRVHPPDWLVKAIAARGQWPGVRRLEGIVEEPTLRPDGTILDTAGYDEATGLLYEP